MDEKHLIGKKTASENSAKGPGLAQHSYLRDRKKEILIAFVLAETSHSAEIENNKAI